jgi:hypothetical protein
MGCGQDISSFIATVTTGGFIVSGLGLRRLGFPLLIPFGLDDVFFVICNRNATKVVALPVDAMEAGH